MKSIFLFKILVVPAVLTLFSVVLTGCPGTYSLPPLAPPPLLTATPTPGGPVSTPTATPTTTAGIPMGNYIAAWLASNVLVSTLGGSPVTTTLSAEALVSYNQAAVTNATVTLTGPGGLVVSFPYLVTLPTIGSATEGVYSALSPAAVTYLPGSTYTITVTDPYGTFTASLVAAGDINWSGSITTTLTAAALYPGGTDIAEVYVAGTTPTDYTYEPLPTLDLGSPFNYPASAFSSPSSPATFEVDYTAAVTQANPYSGAATASFFSALQEYNQPLNK